MAVTSRRMPVPSQAVWAVLKDGRSYGDWVVGTRMIREVDANWPGTRSRLHYTIGYGPLRKDDQTEVLAVDPERRLELRAHAWPAGTVKITITLHDEPGGTRVAIEEYPDQGLARTLHTPLSDLLVHVRNRLTLRRLEELAAGRLSGRSPAEPG